VMVVSPKLRAVPVHTVGVDVIGGAPVSWGTLPEIVTLSYKCGIWVISRTFLVWNF